MPQKLTNKSKKVKLPPKALRQSPSQTKLLKALTKITKVRTGGSEQTTPDDVKNLEDKVKNDYISLDNIDGPMFKFENFTCIANGLNKFNRSNIESQLRRRNLFNTAKLLSEQVKTNKLKYMSNTTNSKAYVELMRSK